MSNSLEWWPKQFGPGDIDGDGALKLLGQPNLHPVSVLVRETAQNSWDARVEETIRYWIHGRTLRGRALNSLRDRVFANPGKGLTLRNVLAKSSLAVLEISDRGTGGLGGPLRNDRAHEARTTDYIDFVLNIGAKRDKQHGGGTYGFGKTISYIASTAHTILIWSRSREGKRIESRLIGSAFGDCFELRGKRYTGRQWWGRKVDRGAMVEPLLGEEADDIARKVFASSFEKDETGTSLMIIDPSLLELDLPHLVDSCGEAILWHLWPKLVEPPGAEGRAPMQISLKLEDDDVAIPDPKSHEVLGGYVQALQTVRSVQSGAEAPTSPLISVSEIRIQRPQATLGHLAICTSPAASKISALKTEDRDSIAPIESPTHSVALMRSAAELVVTYLDLPRSPVEGVSVAGVFRCTPEADKYFAASEPPAHDSWEPKGMLDRIAKRHVNVGLRNIRDAWKHVVSGTSSGRSASTGGSEGFLASELSDMVPSIDGGRASRSRTAVPGGGGGGTGGRRSQPKLRITKSSSVPFTDIATVAVVSFELEDWAPGFVVECKAGIGYDGGTDQDDNLVKVEGFTRGLPGALPRPDPGCLGSRLEVEDASQTLWSAIVSHEPGLAVDIDLRITQGAK